MMHHQPASPLPDILSPCNHVRQSCHSLMSDEERCVVIDSEALHRFAEETIVPAFLQRHLGKGGNASSVAAWDEAEWHYTAKQYYRPWLSPVQLQRQRYERVALYILILDCINFCFWPGGATAAATTTTTTTTTNHSEDTNHFEYEHFARALKKLAEKDDTYLDSHHNNDTSTTTTTELSTIDPEHCSSIYNVAQDSYALSPQNIIHSSCFMETLYQALIPSFCTHSDPPHPLIPMREERWRLVHEMATTLIHFFHGSATYFLAQAKQSADLLVYHILSAFPGFRDTAMDGGEKGRCIAFYKRAQILVADLWAALQSSTSSSTTTTTTTKTLKNTLDTTTTSHVGYTYCDFYDIHKLTTFADYRIPQLLHSLNILKYTPTLNDKVHSKNILWPGCSEELYIRAATIVAVDLLAHKVRDSIRRQQKQQASDDDYDDDDDDDEQMETWIVQQVNAVTLDWYLWNMGETLDRRGLLYPHHRVRTIYY